MTIAGAAKMVAATSVSTDILSYISRTWMNARLGCQFARPELYTAVFSRKSPRSKDYTKKCIF